MALGQVSRYISLYPSFFIIILSLLECMLFLLPYSMFLASIGENMQNWIL